MARVTIAVTITPEQNQFLGENKDISPSHLLQSSINQLMESAKSPEFLKELQDQNAALMKNMQHWQQMFYKVKDFAISRSSESEVSAIL